MISDTKYATPVSLNNFHQKLTEQRSEVRYLASKQEGQAYATTRTYVINDIGAEVIVKMKEIKPNLPKNLPCLMGKTGKSSAKIKFISYEPKAFSALKDFFTETCKFSFGPERFYFDNVFTKKTQGKEFLINVSCK